jgi:hypothetical protein
VTVTAPTKKAARSVGAAPTKKAARSDSHRADEEGGA